MAEQSHVSDSDEDQPAKLPRMEAFPLRKLADRASLRGSAFTEAMRRVVRDAQIDPVKYTAFGNAP